MAEKLLGGSCPVVLFHPELKNKKFDCPENLNSEYHVFQVHVLELLSGKRGTRQDYC
jgi:hypothetical protein